MEMVGEHRRKKGMYQGIGDFCDRDRQTQGERETEREEEGERVSHGNRRKDAPRR